MREKLAIAFIERAKELGLKGKKRDELALEFIMGAAMALQNLEQPIDLTKFAWLVSIRGYSAIEDAAKDYVGA